MQTELKAPKPITARGLQPGEAAALRIIELEDLLNRCAEYLYGQIDVEDGDDDMPKPNRAQILYADIMRAIGVLPSGTDEANWYSEKKLEMDASEDTVDDDE